MKPLERKIPGVFCFGVAKLQRTIERLTEIERCDKIEM
jgi:hypothetical protein